MVDLAKIQGFIKIINTNGDETITTEEIEKADGKVPSVFLEDIARMADGKDISVAQVYRGLGVEPNLSETQEGSAQASEKEGEAKANERPIFMVDDPVENRQNAMNQSRFFMRRNCEKWFHVDMNNDGKFSNIEDLWCDECMANEKSITLDGDLNAEQYAKKYGIQKDDKFYGDLKGWQADWKEYVVGLAKEQFGVELNEEEIAELDKEFVEQANRWLLKGGEGDTKSLYDRCNITAYTRLVTMDEVVSCCGGDISKPPIGPQNPDEGCALIFSALGDGEDSGANQAYEVKNRLAWAAFNTLPQSEIEKMTPDEYKKYQNKWQKVRDLSATEFRDMLRPENAALRAEFEDKSIMTVKQIVDYIDIVESVTGKAFDDENWSIGWEEYHQICEKVNGTFGDEELLKDKTKEDVLPERQELYNYLKENGMLLPQFE